MATSITQARSFLTAAELELFDHSRAQPIKELSDKQLAGKVKRARALRDKYRDLYRRQTLAARGKASRSGALGDANARTQRKADIMQEMLDRFEARTSLLAARAERAGSSSGTARKVVAPKAVVKRARFAGKNPAKRSLKAPSPRAPSSGGKVRAPNVNAPLDMVASAKRVNPIKSSPGSVAIQGHVSSSVRRSQGKRDNR